MSVLRQSAWAGAAAIALAGSRFAFAGIVARRVPVEAFGQFAYGQWLVDVTFLICSLGTTGAIARYVAEFRGSPALLAAFVRRWRPVAIGVPVLAAGMVLVGVKLSGLSLDPLAFATLPAWTLANGMLAVQAATLSGLQRFDVVFFSNATAAAVLVAGAPIVPLGARPVGAVFALAASAAFAGAVVGHSVTRAMPIAAPAPLEPERWRSMTLYALNMWLAQLLNSLVWSRGEVPIVRSFLGDAGVAHYAASLTLFAGAIQGVMLAASGAPPQLTRLLGEGAQESAVTLARKVMDVQLLLCGLAAVFLVSFSPELMRLTFGDAYVAQSGALAILGIGLLAMAVYCQNHLLQIVTDARFSRNSTIAGLLLLLGAAAAVLALGGDVLGAASARAGTMFIMAAVSLFAVHRRWGSRAYSGMNVAKVLFITTACGVAQVWLGRLNWPVRTLSAAVSAALIACSVRSVEGPLQVRIILNVARRALMPASAIVSKVE